MSPWNLSPWRRALALVAALCTAATAAAAPPPVEVFMRPPEVASARPSPDGRLIAALIGTKAGFMALAVLDPADFARSRVVAQFSDADVGSFQWISPRRLVFTASDLGVLGGNAAAPGLFAVDVDGTAFRQLAERVWRGGIVTDKRVADRTLPFNTRLYATTRQLDSDDVFVIQYPLVGRPGDEGGDPALLRLNTRTGEARVISRDSPPGHGRWLLDEQGEPRVFVGQARGRVQVFVRDGAGGSWRAIADHPEEGAQHYAPVRLLPGNRMLVVARVKSDTSALHVLDMASGTLDPEPVVQVQGFDFEGSPYFDEATGALRGVHVQGDAPASIWLDPVLQAAQAAVDARLPRTVNLIFPPALRDAAWLLVASVSDRQPPVLSIYRPADGSVTLLARSRPAIDPRTQGETTFTRIAARDGQPIPVYVTRPPGATAAGPTVVLVHGGPWVRGVHWGWDREVQFLVSRGYTVVQPEFRGSTGYGYRLFRAGWKQWGQAMQDDVADAARWAVASGYADGRRICIAGASYGGYATLMGLIRDPALYRCGVAWVAVTDPLLLYTATWSDIGETARSYRLPRLLGDPRVPAEDAMLKSVSPLRRAAQLRQPLLLAMGAADLRVPLEHGTRLRDALASTNPEVEWVVYPEGHGWGRLDTRVDFWNRVERFLARHLAVTEPDPGTAARSAQDK